MSRLRKVLFVSPRQCLPALSGAKLRDYHLARALGSRTELHYVFFRAPHSEAPTPADLPFCRKIAAMAPAVGYTPVKIAAGLLGRWPISVLNYTSPEMTAALAGIAADCEFDLVHLDSVHLARYEPLLRTRLPRARIVYDWHNIESDIMRQYAQHAASPARKLYSALTARKLTALERRILASAFGHVVCSARERAQLRAIAPQARIEVIENGVDTPRFKAPDEASYRHRVLFMGLMNYHANVEAAVWFTRQIWPALHRRFPQWTLTLAGADPAAAVVALAREEAVEVTGTVPDVAPYYREAVVAIVPLHSGGGTRLKILEAMAAGVPVVSTAIGAEGLDVSPGVNFMLAPGEGSDAAGKWTEAIAQATSLPLRGSLVGQGLALVASRYDWDVIGERLSELYLSWMERP